MSCNRLLFDLQSTESGVHQERQQVREDLMLKRFVCPAQRLLQPELQIHELGDEVGLTTRCVLRRFLYDRRSWTGGFTVQVQGSKLCSCV